MAKKQPKTPHSGKKQASAQADTPRTPKASGSPAWLPALLLHGGILVGFLVILFLYFSPVIKGEVLLQGDIVQYKGMSKEVTDYRAETV